jgi:hypothetical protein
MAGGIAGAQLLRGRFAVMKCIERAVALANQTASTALDNQSRHGVQPLIHADYAPAWKWRPTPLASALGGFTKWLMLRRICCVGLRRSFFWPLQFGGSIHDGSQTEVEPSCDGPDVSRTVSESGWVSQ